MPRNYRDFGYQFDPNPYSDTGPYGPGGPYEPVPGAYEAWEENYRTDGISYNGDTAYGAPRPPSPPIGGDPRVGSPYGGRVSTMPIPGGRGDSIPGGREEIRLPPPPRRALPDGSGRVSTMPLPRGRGDPRAIPFESRDPRAIPFESRDPRAIPFESRDPRAIPFESRDPRAIPFESRVPVDSVDNGGPGVGSPYGGRVSTMPLPRGRDDPGPYGGRDSTMSGQLHLTGWSSRPPREAIPVDDVDNWKDNWGGGHGYDGRVPVDNVDNGGGDSRVRSPYGGRVSTMPIPGGREEGKRPVPGGGLGSLLAKYGSEGRSNPYQTVRRRRSAGDSIPGGREEIRLPPPPRRSLPDGGGRVSTMPLPRGRGDPGQAQRPRAAQPPPPPNRSYAAEAQQAGGNQPWSIGGNPTPTRPYVSPFAPSYLPPPPPPPPGGGTPPDAPGPYRRPTGPIGNVVQPNPYRRELR